MNSGLCVPSSPSFLKAGPISKTRSRPPITRRFSQISGAIRIVNFLSENSDADVVKGRAIAPPAEEARIGVCTSKNDESRKYWRMDWMI